MRWLCHLQNKPIYGNDNVLKFDEEKNTYVSSHHMHGLMFY
jgi:hypothetical protein